MVNGPQKEQLISALRDVQDYPRKGIVFKDITTLLNDAQAFRLTLDILEARYKNYDLDFIAGAESRGFMFAAPLADRLGAGFIPIRKKGKLPSTTLSEKYTLEYGFGEVEIHLDAFRGKKDPKVLFIDDVIATGGTSLACANIIGKAGGECMECCFLINLKFLDGEKQLLEAGHKIYSMLEF